MMMMMCVKLGLSTTVENSNLTSVNLVGLFPAVFYVTEEKQNDKTMAPVSSVLSILV
jgi:hypothetical protein